MTCSTQKLIACVRKYPLLYDNTNLNFSNTRKKHEVWNELSEKLGATPAVLKKKWNNLRDFYVKYLHNEGNDVGYAGWPWARHMRPFRPYMSSASQRLRSQVKIEPSAAAANTPKAAKHFTRFESESSEQEENELEENTVRRASPQYRRQRPKRVKLAVKNESQAPPTAQHSPVVQQRLELDDSNCIATAAAQLSANELLFLGFAKIVETFSARRQAAIKNKIANLVFEEELFECNETEAALHTPRYLDTESALHDSVDNNFCD